MSGVLTSSGMQSLAGVHVHTSGGTKPVGFARVRTPTGINLFFQSLASGGGGATGATPGISVSPADVVGTINSSAPSTATSRATTVTATGGLAPYTYLWSQVSGAPMTATAPTAATTKFTDILAPATEESAVWKCTVTDAAGVSADSPQVSVDLENFGGTL